ncbi:uncharacterized protein LOC114381774 [Glycine soja]|uniref:VQ domain-containing protein n=1 Tax=Glycine soja TaxID=3848 RepID=A0A445HHT3_GLYSO|nr:uncharacterized protein LOC114381774 [Glycine soja]KAG4975328.1 hypothetical protein JHK87_032149 [Glycine soja]KHN44336.1 hypothetical protein glysoja_014377 [Glycine soja]RZB73148.1 hypothetical protein D0Y65_037063 [Glycine soja]RZB73149.1 hypothetical protein D0Y65_037063 [Glycine soja]
MDSGNSGSMQSSSTAGDEEYDSRADPSLSSSISAFFNSNSHPSAPPQPTTLTNHVGPPFSTQHHHVFDPLSSNYLDPTQRSPQSNQILNLDMVRSKVAARSGPDFSSFIPSSSPHNNNNQAFLLTQLGGGGVNNVGAFPSTTLPPESGGGGLVMNEQVNSSNTNKNMVRNPKKRSRASRRAPTTVLTTDTTNFRAMVQEFTGIPAPPFTSSSSSFPRTRLDLFATSNASSSSIIREQTPSYLLRPFAHKVQAQVPSSIPPPSSFQPMLNNYHHHHHQHNPILSFQSILQPHQLIGSKTQQQPSLEIPPSALGLEELGLNHAHHQNINMRSSSSDGTLSRVNNDNNNMRGPSSADWAQAQAQRIDNNDGGLLGSLTGATLNYRSNIVSDQRVKVTNNSDFHGEKGPECVVAVRSEGMVESWINCSSD